MILGGLVLAAGCVAICENEEILYVCQQALAQVQGTPLEAPCLWNATLGAPMVHLEGCDVSGAHFDAATPGLEELRFFGGCMPDGGIQGAWLKVNIERYSGANEEWIPTESFNSLHSVEKTSPEVHIGGFSVSDGIARMIPGSIVPLKACIPSADPDAPEALSSWRVHDHELYSGNPGSWSDGDVKVSLLAGDTRQVSILAAASAGHLDLWHLPLRGLDAFARLPRLGVVEPGAVPAEAMLRRLAPHSSVSFWHLWPLRVVGAALIWLGMSLLLFPNRVFPDLCGKYCCCRSLPGALVTAVTTAGASWCFFRQELAATVVVVVLVPMLLALAAGVDFRDLPRQARECWSGSSQDDESAVSYHAMAAASTSTLSRSTRMGALGVSVGLIIAGPAVQSFVTVVAVGDIWNEST